MENKLYFAYGSNINLNQMEYRCPDARVVQPVVLEDHELLFRGYDRGVATIAPKKGSKVYGLLWSLTPACEKALNRYEGYPRMYKKTLVPVKDKTGKQMLAMAYAMTAEYCYHPALPTLNYYKGIREGFRQNGLPEKAVWQALQNVKEELMFQLPDSGEHTQFQKRPPFKKQEPQR